jgi:hypothetical protein
MEPLQQYKLAFTQRNKERRHLLGVFTSACKMRLRGCADGQNVRAMRLAKIINDHGLRNCSCTARSAAKKKGQTYTF